MASSVYIFRDLKAGPMQYAVSNKKPIRSASETAKSSPHFTFHMEQKSSRMELTNEIAKAVCGRELEYGECVEVVCSEVV